MLDSVLTEICLVRKNKRDSQGFHEIDSVTHVIKNVMRRQEEAGFQKGCNLIASRM